MRRFVRKLMVLLCAAWMLMSFDTLALADEGEYIPGTYTATARGMGEITVTITVDETTILDVVIVGEGETPQIGSLAVEQMPAMILASQSEDVDVVSEATLSSNGIKKALSLCLAQARGEVIEEPTTEEMVPEKETTTEEEIAAEITKAETTESVVVEETSDEIDYEAKAETWNPAVIAGIVGVVVIAVFLVVKGKKKN